MKNGRNSSGRFEKGHGGFKPKGAITKKKQKRDQLLNHVLSMLGESLAESIHSMPPNQLMKLYLALLKLSIPKMARIPYIPDPPVNPVSKVTFKVVDSGTKISSTNEKSSNPETLKP